MLDNPEISARRNSGKHFLRIYIGFKNSMSSNFPQNAQMSICAAQGVKSSCIFREYSYFSAHPRILETLLASSIFPKVEFTLYCNRSFQQVRENTNSGSGRKVPNGGSQNLLLFSAAALFFRALPASAAPAHRRVSSLILAIVTKHTVAILQPTFCLCSLSLKLH